MPCGYHQRPHRRMNKRLHRFKAGRGLTPYQRELRRNFNDSVNKGLVRRQDLSEAYSLGAISYREYARYMRKLGGKL